MRQNFNSPDKIFGTVSHNCYSLHGIFGTVGQNCNSPHKDFDTVKQNCDLSNIIFKILATLENCKFQNSKLLQKLILDAVGI